MHRNHDDTLDLTPDQAAPLPVGWIDILGCRCRCGHEWLHRSPTVRPATCPKCKSPNWDTPTRTRVGLGRRAARRGPCDGCDHEEARVTPTTYWKLYLPVTHSNGARLVRVINQDGTCGGWAPKQGDIPGTWEIDDAWAPEQDAAYRKAVRRLYRTARQLTFATDGVGRRVTVDPGDGQQRRGTPL